VLDAGLEARHQVAEHVAHLGRVGGVVEVRTGRARDGLQRRDIRVGTVGEGEDEHRVGVVALVEIREQCRCVDRRGHGLVLAVAQQDDRVDAIGIPVRGTPL
jgi:hypothetical protein